MSRINKTVRKIRVAHLTSVHSPLDVRIYDKECCSLFAEGYDAVVVGPGESRDDGCRPRVSGVAISRSRFRRIVSTVPSVFWEALRVDADIYHLHDPELIPMGLFLKALGKKVIFDSHENIVLDAFEKPYLPLGTRRLYSGLAEALVYLADHYFDGIVAANAHIANSFANKDTTVVNNFPEWPECELEPHTTKSFSERAPIIAYVGGISANRGIREMVEAVELVARSTPVTLALAGSFESPKLEREVRAMPGWRLVDYRGMLTRSEVAELLSEAICGLLILHPTGNYIRSNPIKLYEYLALCLPVIMSDFPTWRELLSSLDVALFVEPRDLHQIADSIQWLLANRRQAAAMGQRGKVAVNCQFNWSSERTKLLGLYRKILGSIADPKYSENVPSENTCGKILGDGR